MIKKDLHQEASNNLADVVKNKSVISNVIERINEQIEKNEKEILKGIQLKDEIITKFGITSKKRMEMISRIDSVITGRMSDREEYRIMKLDAENGLKDIEKLVERSLKIFQETIENINDTADKRSESQ